MTSTIKHLNWQKVDSSNLDAVAYDEPSKTLAVQFQNGGLYAYHAVDMEVYTSLTTAPSVGKYLSTHVKPFFPYEKWESEDSLVSYIEDLKKKA